jgi:Ca-activated chloride channel family protein
VLLALAASTALSGGLASHADAAGLLIADGGFGGVLEIKDHDVTVVVNNGIAVTEIEQTFVNTERRQVEALYTFPVPKAASVASFSMWIGGKEMIGEVVEKERARQIYESYKQTRRDPGLLEQVDHSTFEMRIFPIAAGAEQRVKLTYYQELDVDHDWATYVYPLATVTRADIDQRTHGRFSLSLEVKSAVPIVAMESPSHADDFVFAQHASEYWQASLETDGSDLSRDVVLAYELSRPRTGIDVITSRERGDDGYVALTVSVGEELAQLDLGMDYVFVLDVSGSMARDGKLQLSTNGIDAFVEALGPDDRFEVISFNVQAETLFDRLLAAEGDAIERASAFLAARQARGGTDLLPALETAYRYADPDRPLNVVIFSDGMTEQSDRQSLLQVAAQAPGSCRVFCVGVGNEVDRPLLRQLARDAGGLAAFLSRGDDFSRQAKAFRRKLTRPAATDVQIEFAGGGVYDVEPKTLPSLYHGTPIRMYARYRDAGDVRVTVRADVLGRPGGQTIGVALPAVDASNPEIERMWAWHAVQRLLGERDRDGESAAALEQIIALGEDYSIATEYTSFIVLENDAEYKRWKIDRRNSTRIARDRDTRARRRAELERLRAQARAGLGPAEPALASFSDRPTRPARRESSLSPSPSTGDRDLTLPMPTTGRRSGGGQGGGAIDPLTGGLILSVLGGAVLARRRRRDTGETG